MGNNANDKIVHRYDVHRQDHTYRQFSNIRGTLVGYRIIDHSDAIGASPVGAADKK